MNAVERVEEYTRVNLEKFEGDDDESNPSLQDWPKKGAIEYQKAVARSVFDCKKYCFGFCLWTCLW